MLRRIAKCKYENFSARFLQMPQLALCQAELATALNRTSGAYYEKLSVQLKTTFHAVYFQSSSQVFQCFNLFNLMHGCEARVVVDDELQFAAII